MFDRVILSTDENFKDFLPVCCKAWKFYFPNTQISVAFVTEREESDSLVKEMRTFCEVVLFKPVDNISTANQAKFARHYLATTYGSDVCMIEDIDTIPLQSEFYTDRTSKRPANYLLAVGAEVLRNTPDSGKFPISTMTAESDVFKQFINPKGESFQERVESFVGTKVYDHKEDISNPWTSFSDESLMRALINDSEVMVHHVDRAVDIRNFWIDRSWWSIDPHKLKNNLYVACNFKRPFIKHYNEFIDIIKHINNGSEPNIEQFTLKGE